MIDGTTVFMIIRVLVLAFLLWLFYGVVRSCVFVMRGSPERAPRLGSQIIGLVIAFILLWPITGIRLEQRYLERRYRPQLYEVAEKLGYTTEDFLTEGSTCSDPLLTFYPLTTQSCRLSLYFTTNQNADGLEPLVMQLSAERIRNNEGTIYIPSEFSSIHLHTLSLLSIIVEQISAGSNSATEMPSSEWRFYNNDDDYFQMVKLYEITGIPDFVFDGQPIKKNIIRLEVELGRAHLY